MCSVSPRQDRTRHVLQKDSVFWDCFQGASIRNGIPQKHTGDCWIKSYLVFYFRRPNNNRQLNTLQPVWRADGCGTLKYIYTHTHLPLFQSVLNDSIMIWKYFVAYAHFIQKHLLNRCWFTHCEVLWLTIKRRETVTNTHISLLPQNVQDIRVIPSRF